MLLAESLFGWYLGLTIAFALIVVVVAIVASILTLAARIAEQAPVAAEGLNQVEQNTSLIPAVEVNVRLPPERTTRPPLTVNLLKLLPAPLTVQMPEPRLSIPPVVPVIWPE